MRVIGRKSIKAKSDLIERKNQEEQPGISWLEPSDNENTLMRDKATIDSRGSP